MAIIKKYKSEILNIENVIEDVYVVTFKSIEKQYKYLPGQFLHLALDDYDPSMPWPESRCFSIQSNENDVFLKITFSVKGKFTKRMAEELKIGKVIYLKLPYGEIFSKEHDKNNAVFIAGGTGITPFLSLFTSAGFSYYKNPKLYLGLRNSGYNIYVDELKKANEINGSFDINIYFQDKIGILNIDDIFTENGKKSTYFVSGPPVMIKNFKTFLISEGVNETSVITDDWE
jgi:predicted ferric reductase